jgi:hypothetical protein
MTIRVIVFSSALLLSLPLFAPEKEVIVMKNISGSKLVDN